MYISLVVGFAIGLILIGVLRRQFPRWRRIHIRLSLLVVAMYGFAPAILMRLGVIETSALGVAIAIGYFLAFSVVGAVLLNGIAIRAARSRIEI